jgi:hypothetical protein
MMESISSIKEGGRGEKSEGYAESPPEWQLKIKRG